MTLIDMADTVDVSHDQRSLNWATIAGTGFSAAYIHATHGTHQRDPSLDTHLTQAKDAGLATGLIHTPKLTTASAEARHFADILNLRHAARPGNLPPCLDLHLYSPTDLRNRKIIRWINTFFSTLRVTTGRRQVLLRAGLTSLRLALAHARYLDDDVLLWISHYGKEPGTPGFRDHRTIGHHYTNRGRLDDHLTGLNISYFWPPLTTLTAGSALINPGARHGWHTVRPGETLRSIADRYQILGGWKTLWDINRDVITDPDILFSDQKIRLPN